MPTSSPPRRQIMVSTIIGIAATVGLLVFVVVGHGSKAGIYVDPMGIVIVLGGTIGASFLSFRTSQISSIGRALFAIFEEEAPIRMELAAIEAVAGALQKAQIQSAEAAVRNIHNPFLRLGLQLVVDRVPVEDVQHVMDWRIQKLVERETAEAKLFRTMADFAPGFGMVGTLTGMVSMLSEMGSGDMKAIGSGMALALVATLYGVILSNLVFRPIAIKLEQRTQKRVARMNVLMEGIVLVALGRGPVMVRDSMSSFLRDYRDEMYD